MKLLNLNDSAKIMGVSRQTTMRMITEGVLPAICLRSGKRKKVWRIREEVLERWILVRERQTAKG